MRGCCFHASIGGDAPASSLVGLGVDKHLGSDELLLDYDHLSTFDRSVLCVFGL